MDLMVFNASFYHLPSELITSFFQPHLPILP
jgi:hypothetical protein